MKNNVKCLRIIICSLFVLLFLSCSSDMDELNQTIEKKNDYLRSSPISKNNSLKENWENITSVVLNNGLISPTPWKTTDIEGVSNAIPRSYREDVKKVDGWVMLHHSMIYEKSTAPNYMLFYNRLRGLLKIYYYRGSESTTSNTIWVLRSKDRGTPIFSSNSLVQGLINTPYDIMTTSPILDDASFTFGALFPGWNSCSFELVYANSGNIDPVVSIYTYNASSGDIALGGKYAGEVVIPIGGSQEANVIKLGKSLKDVGKLIPGISSITNGISTAASVMGKSSVFSKQTTSYIHATSSGTVNLSGNMLTLSSGATAYLNDIPLKKWNNNLDLGLWSLKESPTFYYNQYCIVNPMSRNEWSSTTTFYEQKDIKSLIVINPTLISEIKNYTVSYQFLFDKTVPEAQNIEKLTEDNIYRGSTSINYLEKGTLMNFHLNDLVCVEYFARCPNSLIPKKITLNVEFNYHNGSKFLSSRTFNLPTPTMKNNSSDINKQIAEWGCYKGEAIAIR